MPDESRAAPETGPLLLVDSGAAALGGAMGCSSVTTYVECGAGVAEGGRTGLTSLVVAVLFVLAILFVPLIALVGQNVGQGHLHAPGDRARAGDGRLPDDLAR